MESAPAVPDSLWNGRHAERREGCEEAVTGTEVHEERDGSGRRDTLL